MSKNKFKLWFYLVSSSAIAQETLVAKLPDDAVGFLNEVLSSSDFRMICCNLSSIYGPNGYLRIYKVTQGAFNPGEVVVKANNTSWGHCCAYIEIFK